jgi:hypothetical protein
MPQKLLGPCRSRIGRASYAECFHVPSDNDAAADLWWQSKSALSPDLPTPSLTFLRVELGTGFFSPETLIAAENTGRVCCGVELDPLYVDVILRRYEVATGTSAILADTGEPFATVAARRRNDDDDANNFCEKALRAQVRKLVMKSAGIPSSEKVTVRNRNLLQHNRSQADIGYLTE